jgi:EmrB/QacA subfamily drug resistance transporter
MGPSAAHADTKIARARPSLMVGLHHRSRRCRGVRVVEWLDKVAQAFDISEAALTEISRPRATGALVAAPGRTMRGTDRRSRQTTPSRRWSALPVMLSAVFLAAFDFNVVTVAIPSIQRGLATTFSEIQLIVAGYALSFAVLLISGGRLGDLYGRRRLFVIGMTGFTIASALCGFARVPTELVGARVLQGAFAAVMVPQALSFIQVTFTHKEQSVAYAIYGMTIGAGMISGQVLGGLLVNADVLGLAWRPVFLINLPIGALAIALTGWLVPESRAPAGLRLDVGGVVLVSAALLLLLYPLIRGEEAGWPTWTRLSLAGSALVMHLFLQYERWKTERDGSPLLVLSLFRHRSFVVGITIAVAFFSGLASFLLLLTEYLQTGLERTPRAAGLTFVPFAIGFLSASLASARLAPRLGRSILQLGAALMVIGLLALVAVVDRRADAAAYILPLFIYGLGQGNLQSPLVNFILADVPPTDAGSASGVVTTVQQLSFALGVAVIGGVFAASLGPHAAAARYGEAFVHALAWNIGLLALTFIASFALPRRQRVLRVA